MAKTEKRSVKRPRSGVVFLVTFLVFLALFGGVMIWGVSEFWRQNYTETPDAAPTTVSAADHTASETRRLLLITEEDGAAQGFVLLCAEPAAGRIVALPLPRETVVTLGTSQSRLFELYAAGGTAAVTEQVERLTGEPIGNTAVITYEGIRKWITYLGDGVIFTLNEEVRYENRDGAAVTMKSGARTLSAAQATDLLQYTGWHAGRRGQADVQAQLAAAIINQYLLPSRFDEENTDFYTLMNLWRSDIRVSQFAACRDDLLSLARRNHASICTVVFPAGEYVGVGEEMRFEMAASDGNG